MFEVQGSREEANTEILTCGQNDDDMKMTTV